MKLSTHVAVGLVGSLAGRAVANYAPPQQTYSAGAHHNECAATPCGMLGSLTECSPEWFDALNVCFAPPCNIRYVRDPAAACSAKSKAVVQATATKDAIEPTSVSYDYPFNFTYPECVKPCLKDFVRNDGCSFSDISCHCSKSDAFMKVFEDCDKACSGPDWKATLLGLITECSAAEQPLKAAETKMPSLKRRNSPNEWYPDIPDCAKPCYDGSISSVGCATEDCSCHCEKFPEYKDTLGHCLSKECGLFCQKGTFEGIGQYCKARGFDIATPTISTPTAPSTTPGCPSNDYPSIPECAQGCFNQTVTTDGCCVADTACHCARIDVFQSSLSSCVVNDCPARKDQRDYIKALEQSCASVCFKPDGKLLLPPRPSSIP